MNKVELRKKIKENSLVRFLLDKPLLFLGVVLVILMVLIVLANYFRNKVSVEEIEKKIKKVSIYRIGQSPKMKVLADVRKENVIQILAQTGGVVQNLYVSAGTSVWRGQNLAYISSNYQGGSALILQKQIAQKQKENMEETYDTQKEIILKQKDLANKVDANNDELMEISKNSIGETKDIVSLNDDILNRLEESLKSLEEASASATNDSLIISTKSSMAQLKGSNLSLKSSIRQLEYQTNGDKPPAQMSDLQKDLTIKQLEIGEKALDLQKEISVLQYNLALINESLAFPSSYSDGIVEEVHVKPGETVGPGSLLFTISSDLGETTARAYVPAETAKNISKIEKSRLNLNGHIWEMMPCYVSTEATKDLLYMIQYNIPKEYEQYLTDKESVEVEIPVGYADTNSVMPFIPLDGIYQNSEKDFVFVNENGVAVVKEVKLGQVFGGFVEIEEGMGENAEIILNRNVIEGDEISVN